jgi:hypothetical protein
VRLERILSVLGNGLCQVICVVLWLVIQTHQPMWPFPALYLLEMAILSILITWGLLSNESRPASLRYGLVWAGIGLIVGFILLGSFSIGFAFIPTALLLATAAILSDRRQRGNLLLHLGVAFAAALVQVALMLAVIKILYR